MKLAPEAKLFINPFGRKYVFTGYTVAEWDKLEEEIKTLKSQIRPWIPCSEGLPEASDSAELFEVTIIDEGDDPDEAYVETSQWNGQWVHLTYRQHAIAWRKTEPFGPGGTGRDYLEGLIRCDRCGGRFERSAFLKLDEVMVCGGCERAMELEKENATMKAVLNDEAALHMNILRGTVKLSRERLLHAAAATDYEEVKAENAKLKNLLDIASTQLSAFQNPKYVTTVTTGNSFEPCFICGKEMDRISDSFCSNDCRDAYVKRYAEEK